MLDTRENLVTSFSSLSFVLMASSGMSIKHVYSINPSEKVSKPAENGDKGNYILVTVPFVMFVNNGNLDCFL